MNVKVRIVFLLCTVSLQCIFFFLKSVESVPWKISGGARSIPLTTLEFLHDNTILPPSSMCSLILRLTIVHTSYETFKDAMTLSIKGNDCFGGR